ncbi:MAG TPA: fluoride efflux transporter CrcB [Bacteroidetes bacterium]|nr:fluoride efflux transporter CrcB [Bacteroidota bacterium]
MDRSILLVGLGGFIGSILRHLIGSFISRIIPLSFPFATLSINVIGCLVIGALYGAYQKHGAFTEAWWLFLAVGVCGGFTTFSAFSLEGLTLLQNTKFLPFFAYLSLSIILCFAAIWAGMSLFNNLFQHFHMEG